MSSLVLAAWSASARAETFFVTDTSTPASVDVLDADCDSEGANDTISVGALCAGTTAPCDAPGISLAEALCAANVSPGPDTIVLAAGATYAVPCTHNSWYGRNALPIVTSEVVIEGRGARIERSSGEYCRFFFVSGAFAEAQAPTVGQAAPRGHLTLRELTLANGWVRGGAGEDGGGGGAGLGGAIYNEGTLVLDSVLLVGNRAEGGPFYFGETQGAGGGLSGAAAGVQSSFGSLLLGGGGGFGGPNLGSGRLFVGGGFGSVADGTRMAGFGGGANSGYGPPPWAMAGFGGGGGLAVAGGFGGGGGYGANGGFGGGAGGRSTAADSQENLAGFGGGASPAAYGGGGAGLGGAIFNALGTLRAINCTFVNNQALGGQGQHWEGGTLPVSGGAHGGAIFNLNGHVTLRSTTLDDNAAHGATTPSSGAPSGTDVYSKAEYDAVPPELRSDARLELYHCIVASSESPALVEDVSSAGVLTSVVTGEENILVSHVGNVGTSVILSATPPSLGLVADNGGLTLTCALPSSQDEVPTSNAPCVDLDGGALGVDQRGVARPATCCDPGSYQRALVCDPDFGADMGLTGDGGARDHGVLDGGNQDAGSLDAGNEDVGAEDVADASRRDASLDEGVNNGASDAARVADMQHIGSDTGVSPTRGRGGGCTAAAPPLGDAAPWALVLVLGALGLRRHRSPHG
ncbi:MAG: hypothetical protein KC668_07700 [Myxococcales bacterium]|nr:hypothetical protein [Myxococcales bacterium]